MQAAKRRNAAGLIRRLADEPYRFEFFQAVRLLLSSRGQSARGNGLDGLESVIRFRNSISLAFPPSEIEAIEFEWSDEASASGDNDMPFRHAILTPSFIGLTGPSGVLPRHYTQHVAEREFHQRDFATRAFLDIFTSRAVALFYRSWLKYRLHFQYESDRSGSFLPLVLHFAGIGLSGTRNRLLDDTGGIADESLAHYAAALRARPQPLGWFARVASDYFGTRFHAEQFVGQWFDLPSSERTRLGMANCALGQTSFCGGRIWDRQSKVRITIGPLRRKQFDDFLPGAPGSAGVRRLFHLMVGTVVDCEVRLLLDKRDTRTAYLDSHNGDARLGWTAWCGSLAEKADVCDTTYLIPAGDRTD